MSDENTLEDRIKDLEEEIRHIKSAFVNNEYGERDYSGHRVFHRERLEDDKAVKKRNSDIKTNALTWLSGAIITIILTQLFSFNPEILKLIGKP